MPFALTDKDIASVHGALQRRHRDFEFSQDWFLSLIEAPRARLDPYWAAIGLRECGSLRCTPALQVLALGSRVRDVRVVALTGVTHLMGAEATPWLMERLEEISAKSSLAQAIRYTLNHWAGLTVFLADGRVEVDNNTVERSIRPIPLGRKNALFAGSHTGGERWAILASLINTAKLHALDPQTWLADVLDRIVSGRTKANALAE